MIMWYSIDRFEDSLVILIGEDENQKIENRSKLPPEVNPGDMLRFEDGYYLLDAAKTLQRREEIQALQDLFREKE